MLELVYDGIHHWLEFYEWCLGRADERVADWLLMQSYTPTLVLTALYLFIVWAGQKVMANRQPFNVKWILFIYNTFMVILNFHICYELITASLKADYSYLCQSVRYTNDYQEMRIARALWWFYFSKLLEFMDTFFFILRKKNNQISFLHVYHHATMFPIWWIGIKWVAGGQSFFGAMVNSFVHVVMYTYYGLSGLGPAVQKYLWWKRYLTILQLVQFLIGLVHASHHIYIDCDFPRWMPWALLFYASSILLLFLNFYYQAYMKARKMRESRKTKVCGEIQNGLLKKNGFVTANGRTEHDKDE